ncbi:MAG TPA: hypothetical protein VFY56_10240 [Propionibacteriaceae bacterium]|nr:hypothetical protein [Propionibacteriaceae bacterium]
MPELTWSYAEKSHGWEIVDDDEVVLMPNKVIRCRFDLNHGAVSQRVGLDRVTGPR